MTPRRPRWDIPWSHLSTLSARAGLSELVWLEMRADDWARLTRRSN